MRYEKLKGTDLKVSKICLGTMTWGEQNTEEEGHQQMDYALDRGVNFFDTAEIYPVPPGKETYSDTEKIIGNWFKKTGKRDQVILASKVAGPQREMDYVRGGSRLNKNHIKRAVEASLQRLQTDYIDLYQTHWPERPVPIFGNLEYTPQEEAKDATIRETLEALQECMKEGKIRHIGVSNETPWGMMQHLRLAKEHGLPEIATIQNVYSLVNRRFENGCAEVCFQEKIGLLAYSPLAFGVLSGKYIGGKRPEGARLTLFKRFSRYSTHPVEEAVKKYKKLAERFDMSLTQMALAFINDRPWVLSNIIGATTLEQLKENIDSIDVHLSEEILEGIAQIHFSRPNPAN